MRTAGVKALVREVLDSLPKPYTQDVIDDVFFAIEHDPDWRQRYESECVTLGKWVVNNWVGQWASGMLGKTGEKEVKAKKSTLIGAYSLLDTDSKTVSKKPNESEALKLMADYYQAHKRELPPEIRLHRDEIVDLIQGGVTAAEAFKMALKA